MLKQDDPKAKEDVSSSVGEEETAIYKFSEEATMDEANPSTIDKSLAPGTEQSLRDADESEEDKNNGEVEKDAKEGGAEMEVVQMESRNNEEGENREGEDIESILVATEAEKELLESIGMGKESCWAHDDNDAEVDRWTKIIRNGKQVIFEAEFSIDFEARTSQVEGPTIPAIGEPSNNEDSGEAYADSVEAPGAEALKAMEARLMNAFQDAMKVEEEGGDDDMDETLVRYAAAEDSKKAKTEKTKSVKNKKKRARKGQGCDTVRSPIGTRRHKLEEAAQKMARYEKKKAAAAEKKKAKKGGKKTV
ncbi:hypothetical protein Bca101_010020 [Brassica carinata]